MDNVYSAPLPGTTLQIITEEWKALSGFHALMRQRMKLEAEHLLQLRQFQESIDPTWSKSGVWALIFPVIELWDSQMDILEEYSTMRNAILESHPTEPSPDKPKEGVTPSSKYSLLHGPYQACQEYQKVASSREGIAELQGWFGRNQLKDHDSTGLEPLPMIDRNYRESVVAQRNILRPIAEWHSTTLPGKLEAHVRYAEETQECLRDYLMESSRFTTDLVNSISTAQNRLAKFSSLAFIDPSQKCFETELSHPHLQPAVYLNYCLGGVPEPVLGVMSYLPKLVCMEWERSFGTTTLKIYHTLEMEKGSISFDDVVRKLKCRPECTSQEVFKLAVCAIGPLLPIGEGAIRRYKNGIKRDGITVLVKPFPIENCRMAATAIEKADERNYGFARLAQWIIGSRDAKRLLEDIWQKWDFENHCPLPRDVVRTLPVWDFGEGRYSDGKLIMKRTGIPYEPSQ